VTPEEEMARLRLKFLKYRERFEGKRHNKTTSRKAFVT